MFGIPFAICWDKVTCNEKRSVQLKTNVCRGHGKLVVGGICPVHIHKSMFLSRANHKKILGGKATNLLSSHTLKKKVMSTLNLCSGVLLKYA